MKGQNQWMLFPPRESAPPVPQIPAQINDELLQLIAELLLQVATSRKTGEASLEVRNETIR